jgi:hypothetical protein
MMQALQSPVGVGGNHSDVVQAITLAGFTYRIAHLGGNRIETEPAVCSSEGTLTHRRSSTSINTSGQRGG